MIYLSIFIPILFIVVLIVIAVSFFLLRAFRNPVRVHDKTPKEFNIPCEEITIPTKNRKKLYGWWIDGKPDKPVLILIHGWGRNVGKMLPYLKNLYPQGYNFLVFDSRNHGRSDSDDHSSMLKFAEDIMASVDFIKHNKEVAKNGIGLIGLSIGGAASIYAASVRPEIAAVVTVGAFAHSEEMMKKQMEEKHIPYMPFIWLLFKFVEWKIGAKLSDIAPVNNIAKARAQFLIIHGGQDTVVPLEQAHQLMKAAVPRKAKLVVYDDKGHSNCHFSQGFWDTINGFFEKSI